MLNSLLIIIPAWNEAEVIGSVLEELTDFYPDAQVLVVSDGSTDATAQVVRDHGAKVLELPYNLGVGGAMRAGYLYAYRHGYDYALQLDADGQHNPADIPQLLQAAAQSGANVVIGARFAGKGNYKVRGPRAWAMKLLSVVLSRVTHTRLTDTTSGFKLCDKRAIKLFAANYPAEYLGDTVEALVIAARSGLKVTQVPVQMRPRAGGEPSQNPLAAAKFLLRAILALGVALTQTKASAGEA